MTRQQHLEGVLALSEATLFFENIQTAPEGREISSQKSEAAVLPEVNQ